ncbi:MAG: alpha/beta fold hydrolase [Bacteroidota bacterium]
MKWWHLLLGLIGLYGLAIILLNLFLGKMVFLPKKLASDYEFRFDFPFEELWLEGSELTINALFFPSQVQRKGLLIYLHGNADNLQRWGTYTIDFTSIGYDVIAIDYPGYGKSLDSPSEAKVYASAELAWSWAVSRYPAEKIIIYGRSLGSAPASYLSSQHKARMLILETPFYSIPDVLNRRNFFIPWFNNDYHFPNYQFLEDSKNDAYIVQGTRDKIVPYASAVELKPFLTDDTRFKVIEGGGHRNLSTFDEYHHWLRRILE